MREGRKGTVSEQEWEQEWEQVQAQEQEQKQEREPSWEGMIFVDFVYDSYFHSKVLQSLCVSFRRI